MPKYDSVGGSVPAIIEDIRTSPHRPETHQDEPDRENVVGGVELIMHFLFALVIGWGMYWSVEKIGWGMAAAVAYFLPATTFRVLAKTGTLKAWMRYWLDYRLEHHRIDTLAELADRHFDLLELEAQAKQLPPPPETPHVPPAENYVPAMTPEAIEEAIAWAETLYSSDGYLSRRAVHENGKIKKPVLGSRRAGGSQLAQQYLIQRGFLAAHAGGYWVNVKKFPTRVELARLRR